MTLGIMKRIDFCAGHRLPGHGGKCENLHGHNYRLDIHVSAAALDEVGRVIDFVDLKRVFKNWIDENWDHGFVLSEHDQNAIDAVRQVQPHKLYLIPYNPTAENMVRYLMEHVAPQLLGDVRGVQITRLVLWETDTSCAEAGVSAAAGAMANVLNLEQAID